MGVKETNDYLKNKIKLDLITSIVSFYLSLFTVNMLGLIVVLILQHLF